MKQKVLITGGSGLLAVNWASLIREEADVVLGLHQRKVSLNDVDSHFIEFDSVDDVKRILDTERPDIVIHTVGLTSVEKCEKHPDLARYLNITLAEYVAKACALSGVAMVHISTDHLFSGKHAWSKETDVVDAQNEYGVTKAEAEYRVLEFCSKALVIRTNFFAWGPSYRQSFSDVIIESLRKNIPINLFSDVFYTPILIENLVTSTHELLNLNESGIFHIVGDQRLSKYEFGVLTAEKFGLDQSLLCPCHLADIPDLVQRPLDMSLSNQKVRGVLGHELGSADTQLEKLLLQEAFFL